MKKLKEYGVIIFLILCCLGLSFYWFEWRPSQIRIDCGNKTTDKSDKATVKPNMDQLRMYKDLCLLKQGLDK